jgi:multidrug resistance protein, MATE family
MSFSHTYKNIIKLSAPIMLGSAAQNLVALSDSYLLYFKGEKEFAAIGVVGVFYLVIAAIGYGFSRGGQILIARRSGEKQPEKIGPIFQAMVAFSFLMAVFMFWMMRYHGEFIMSLFVKDPEIQKLCAEFLYHRSWGVFFSYAGVSIISLYTGLARTKFIFIDTMILGIVNIFLNYVLIFGKWGFPEYGIGGSGLASSIAEMVAFSVFVIYMVFDKEIYPTKIFKLRKIDVSLIKQQLALSGPIVAQSIVGLGSWLVFFSFIEKLGQRELAITNLVRIIYLGLSIPCWGFASTINTLVSSLIGQGKKILVFLIIKRTAFLSWIFTMVLAIPLLLFPKTFLLPFIGNQNPELIIAAIPIFRILLAILTVFSMGSVFFNGLAGTGASMFGLQVQAFGALIYMGYAYVVVFVLNLGLAWAWSSELVYWFVLFGVAFWYIRSKRWHLIQL